MNSYSHTVSRYKLLLRWNCISVRADWSCSKHELRHTALALPDASPQILSRRIIILDLHSIYPETSEAFDPRIPIVCLYSCIRYPFTQSPGNALLSSILNAGKCNGLHLPPRNGCCHDPLFADHGSCREGCTNHACIWLNWFEFDCLVDVPSTEPSWLYVVSLSSKPWIYGQKEDLISMLTGYYLNLTCHYRVQCSYHPSKSQYVRVGRSLSTYC